MKSQFLLSFFLSSAALAQPFLSAPQTIATVERSTFDTRLAPAMSLARDGSGFLAAWSAGPAPSRIFVARLDGALQPIAPIRKLDSYLGEAYDANYPEIVLLDGGGYAVVWLERERSPLPSPAFAVVARLSPSFEPQPATLVTALRDTGIVHIAGGDTAHIAVLADVFLFNLYADGTHDIKSLSDWTIDDSVAPPSAPAAFARHTIIPPLNLGLCGGDPVCYLTRYSVGIQINAWRASGAYFTDFAGPTLGYGGGTYILVWLGDFDKMFPRSVYVVRASDDGGQLLEPFNFPLTLGTYGMHGTQSRPAIGWDGERFLVAWQSDDQLVGATLASPRKIQNFTLADTPGARNPLVVGVAPGRFVLAYNAGDQIVMRYVDFNAPFRQRAIR